MSDADYTDEGDVDGVFPDQLVTDVAPDWLVGLQRSETQEGFYKAGKGYGVVFSDRESDVLIVSCDNLSQARENPISRSPWGYSFVAKNGWSQLGIMTYSADWFRNEKLLTYLQELAASGFFRKFRKVVMTGTSMGGYGACAFSSLSPGCTVLAFSPQSTLKKDLVPWEKRYSSGRRSDWSGPFADGAAESLAAERVFLVYDPNFEEDVMHMDRFTGSNVVKLRARYSGHKTALFLRRAGLLSAVVREAVQTDMSASRFYALYRGGRSLPWYLNAVQTKLAATGRQRLLPRFAAAVRKMGAEQVARSAEHRAAQGGVMQEAAAKPLGPHQRRLAEREAAAARAALEGGVGLQKEPNQAATRLPVPRPKKMISEVDDAANSSDRDLDLYQNGENLAPLLDTGTLPWQKIQKQRHGQGAGKFGKAKQPRD